MSSLLAHVAVPLLAGRALRISETVPKRRLVLAAAVCAALPDLDVAAPLFYVSRDALLAHRGLLHSLLAAVCSAGLATLLCFRRERREVFGLLLLAAASHPLLDLLTHGDVGVMLFAPLSHVRVLLPVNPLPVGPLGVAEYVRPLGAVLLLDELMFLIAPAALGAQLIRRFRAGDDISRALTAATAAWLFTVALVLLFASPLLGPAGERELRGYGPPGGIEDLERIPLDPLPEQQLVTRFDQLQSLFGRELTPLRVPWSSSFYPSWYGAEAGRWADARPVLLWRTLAGTSPPPAKVSDASGLSPTEKYDLAHDDASYAATRVSLNDSHNRHPLPRPWFGLCNGVASAAINHPEPVRAVDVVSPSGAVVRFHPVDVKALLAKSYDWVSANSILGGHCKVDAFDVGRVCSMNPGGLALATLNYLGRGQRSFLVEVHPTLQSQNYAIASARIDVTRAPYPRSSEPVEAELATRIASLVDVDFHFTLASTLLPVETGNQPAGEAGRYQAVGLHPVPFHWAATLALDANGEIIGGRWRGDPADGPDNVAFPEGGPMLADAGTAAGLEVNPLLRWSFIEALAKASVDEGAAVPRLEVTGP